MAFSLLFPALRSACAFERVLGWLPVPNSDDPRQLEKSIRWNIRSRNPSQACNSHDRQDVELVALAKQVHLRDQTFR